MVPASPPSPSSCAVTCVGANGLAVLTANRSAAAVGSEIRFSGNASWAYVWSWNNASNVSRGGTYLVVSAADNGSLFSFGYSWGDGTAKTTGTALEVGHAGHRFSSPGTYFVQLTVSSGAFTKSSGYTVRVVAGAPLAQLKYPDIFAAATAQEPDSLEPAIDNDSAGGEVLQNVYETLIAVPSGIESVDPLVPRLATDVPSMANNGTSPDGRNYTFQLRTDVMFHDQTRMTATDVSSSFRRLLAIHPADGPSRILEGLMTNRISTLANADCNPSIAGTQNCTIGDWANVTFPARSAVPAYMSAALPPEPSWDTTALNVSTACAVSNSTVAPVGNYTVMFHLLRPYSAFLPILASTVGSILSHACVGRNGGVRWGVPNSILARGAECGSGPFTLTTWSPNQAIVLTRFNQSWRGPAKIPAVHLLPVRDVVSREVLLLAGDVDTAAIDRDHQWDVMNADGTPKSPTLRIAKDRPTFDVSFFGYNQMINLTLYYRAGSAYEEQGCRLLAQGLEALHSREGSPGVILVAVRALDSAAYNRALRDGGLPLALLSWAPRFADPLDSVLPFLRTGSTYSTWIGYGNASLDARIDAAASELNETTRVQEFLDLTARAVLDDVPYLWVFPAAG